MAGPLELVVDKKEFVNKWEIVKQFYSGANLETLFYQEAQDKLVNKVQDKITALGIIDKGVLRRSIIVRFMQANENGFDMEIGTLVSYAIYHEKGTGLYGPLGKVIVPKHAKALRFKAGDSVLFRRSVRGIKPRPFLVPTIFENFSAFLNGVADRLIRALPK